MAFGLGSDCLTGLGASVATDQVEWAWGEVGKIEGVSLGDVTAHAAHEGLSGVMQLWCPKASLLGVGVIPWEGWWEPQGKRKMKRFGPCFEGLPGWGWRG